MPRSSDLRAVAVCCAGAALWLFWGFEHERTDIRAPWTGLTLVSSALAFVIGGYIGRGWRVLIWAALPAAAATWFVDPLILKSVEAEPLPQSGGCDPSCGISHEFFVALNCAQAAVLAAGGVVVRLAIRRISRHNAGSRASRRSPR